MLELKAKSQEPIREVNHTKSSGEYSLIDLRSLGGKVFCLTLDVEQDFGARLGSASYEGLEHIPELAGLLKRRDIPLTCFLQGSLLETHPAEIGLFHPLDVEFELHSYSHMSPEAYDIKFEIEMGKKVYNSFFNRNPLGYRAPLGVINQDDYRILSAAGFKYDSSVFPSFRPGIFNNLKKPIAPYLLNGTNIIEFPFTVLSPIIRVPIALSYIKLLGRPFINLLKTVPCPNLIVFDFHLVDLFQLKCSNNIPIQSLSFPNRKAFQKIYQDGIDGLCLLDELISIFLKKGYVFMKLGDVFRRLSK
jgi:peptidoglycan/xylan/chitin deacetylase (PgdA/CDA1 family)